MAIKEYTNHITFYLHRKQYRQISLHHTHTHTVQSNFILIFICMMTERNVFFGGYFMTTTKTNTKEARVVPSKITRARYQMSSLLS